MISDRSWLVFVSVLAALAAPVRAQAPESRPESRSIAENVTFELVAPAADSRPAESRAARPVALIRITNKNAVPVVLWPFVTLEIRNAKGDVERPSSNRGRFGLRKQACFLEAIEFKTVQPGKSVEWPVSLDLYTHDPKAILGWKLAHGEYSLSARYSYSRPEFVARCKLDCESHADPKRPWNAALELSREASLKIAVSTQGGLIAFTRAGNVWVIDADGKNERQLTRDVQYDRPIRWSPDGRRIIFWKHPEDWHLWSIDVTTGGEKDLTPDGGDCRSPDVSADGKLIAFMSGRDGLSIANADGSNRRMLSKLGHRDAPPAWSKDGSRLAFVHLYSVGEQYVDLDIYFATKDRADAEPTVKSAREPAWSSDGRTLYYLARRKSLDDLFALEVATKSEKNLTSTADKNENAFAVSPDGRRIALVTWDKEWVSAELRLLDADGSHSKPLMKLQGRPASPSWSPDSKRITINSGPDQQPELYVIDADTGETKKITKEGAHSPAWQPG